MERIAVVYWSGQGATEEMLDRDAAESVAYLRRVMG